MTTALFELQPHLRRRLAEALEMETLTPDAPASLLRATLGGASDMAAVSAALRELAGYGISGPGCAAWIRSLEQVAGRTPKPDVVWSGPHCESVHARRTDVVYDELWDRARRSIWVSSYVYFDGQKAFQRLAACLDARPEITCRLLLNIRREWGEQAPAEELISRFARQFWKQDWPGKARPQVFYDPRALELPYREGVLHAKAVVIDEEHLFVTSANLTRAAREDNIELGLLTKDRALAKSVALHFQVLVEQELRPLPSI